MISPFEIGRTHYVIVRLFRQIFHLPMRQINKFTHRLRPLGNRIVAFTFGLSSLNRPTKLQVLLPNGNLPVYTTILGIT